MLMPARKFSAANGYRYGFNGKENDNEVKGEGNQQDYGMRMYDPRLGKFLSVDPLMTSYPWYTPYQFAGNRPIVAIDVDGLEPHDVSTHELKTELKPSAAEYATADDPIAHGKNITPWKDLLNFNAPSNVVQQMRKRLNGAVQEIGRATGSNTNFDYYTVQISKLPNGVKNAGELFEKIRLSFGDYMDNLTDFAALGTSVDYLISGDKNEKAKASLKNSELLQRFKEIDTLPEEEQGVLIKNISAYVRDYRAKQAYAS